MRLDRRTYHILKAVFFALIIYGCGEVGFIEGGPVDNAAPKPLMDEMEPPNATKNIRPEKIVIPFDEFIALNNPGQNIRVVPEDVRLEAKIKRKSLILTPIKGEWQDSTTYAIYLKRAVKDITESNDSLMSFVFATGNILDSLSAAVKVTDAYRNEPVKEVTVGLFEEPLLDDTSKVLPRYIAQTDAEGLAEFSYLKKGSFYVYAFKDDNKNNVLDPREKRGTLKNVLYADTVVTIIPEILLMPPILKQFKVKSNEVLPPSTWTLSFTKPLEEGKYSVVGDHQPVGEWWNNDRDSVVFYFGEVARSGRFKLAYETLDEENELIQDTIMKKFFFRQPISHKLSSNLQRGVLLHGDTLKINLEEAIKDLRPERMLLEGKKEDDSLFVEMEFEVNQVTPIEASVLHPTKLDSVKLTLYPNAIDGFNFPQTDTIELAYQVQPLSKVGSLIIEMDTIPPYGILELLNSKGEVLQAITWDDIQSKEIPNLQPGDYKFRFIVDSNRDGKWTTGDIFTGKEPEKMIWFQDASTIRANWDVKAKLEIISIFYPELLEVEDEEEIEEDSDSENSIKEEE